MARAARPGAPRARRRRRHRLPGARGAARARRARRRHRHQPAGAALRAPSTACSTSSTRASTSAGQPVRAGRGDERFDLVVCNPPYVVSPETSYVYRDGGEGICRDLVEERAARTWRRAASARLPRELDARAATPTGRGPVRAWTAGSGCDVIAFGLASSDPLTYAAGWGRAPGRDPAVTAPRLERWLALVRRPGHRAGQLGRDRCCAAAPRAATTGSWARRRRPRPTATPGAQMRRLMAAQDLLQRLGPRAGGAARTCRSCCAADHRIDQVGRFVPDGSEVESLTLRFTSGLGTRIALDLPTAQALGRPRRRRHAREVLHDGGRRGSASTITRRSRGRASPASGGCSSSGCSVPAPLRRRARQARRSAPRCARGR